MSAGTNCCTFDDVEFPFDANVTQIALAEKHSLVLDSHGNVWAFGRNDYTKGIEEEPQKQDKDEGKSYGLFGKSNAKNAKD